jgi:hypothetical protein
MAKILKARKALVQLLIQALGGSSMDDFARDFKVDEPGSRILEKVSLAGPPEDACKRLLDECELHSGGLDHFAAVIEFKFDSLVVWSDLNRCFLAYRQAVEEVAAVKRSLMTDASIELEKAQPLQQESWHGESKTDAHLQLSIQKVYISYAWGDATPEGQRRAALADNLCNAMKQAGITVLRDCEQVKPGDRISAFMKELAKGDLILVVLSDRYLKSENCMFELYSIWQRALQDQELFLTRVIPLILPDAQLRTTGDKLARGEYWLAQKRDLEARLTKGSLDAMGPIIFSKYDLIKQFSQHTADMLELLTDKNEPRDFDRQAQEGFREVLAQILAARKVAGG